MNGSDSGPCPVVGFGISTVERVDSFSRKLINWSHVVRMGGR
jgi:hypothetical protein